jgi:monoterpene epsilon-lactone hydrolase
MPQHMPLLANQQDRWALPAPLMAIADEHKYVSRLMNLLDDEADVLSEGKRADMECMADILNYITHYPDQYHHPKEELIFDRMGGADKKTKDIIGKLRHGHTLVAELGQGLTEEIVALSQSRSKKKRRELAIRVRSYTRGLREHIQLEESKIFRPAIKLLSAADWKAIDKSIKPIIDPVFGEQTDDKYAGLFGRYINRVASVSTGAVSPEIIESVASTLERLIFTSREIGKLPGRLINNVKATRAQRQLIMQSLGPVRDVDAMQALLRDISENYRSSASASLALVRDALMAQEPLLEDDESEHLGESVTLRSEADLITYEEKPFLTNGSAKISWQATATNLLFRATIKQLMGFLGPDAAEHARKMTFLTDGVPPGVEVEEVAFDQFHARWVRPEKQAATQKTILYLPGGGFIFPASSGHTTIVSKLARKTQSQGLMVHYRLAPEHPFPAGLEDALAAYRYLIEECGISAGDILFAGDSAGGGLTLSLLLAIRDEKLPMPKAVTLISPMADLSFSGASRITNRWRDPMLPTDRRMNAFEMYSGDTPADHPLLSPLFGDLSGLPPILIQVGSTEILLDDALRIARKARSQGVDVEVEVWNSLPHVWHLWSYIPEADRALSRIARFMIEHSGAVESQLA